MLADETACPAERLKAAVQVDAVIGRSLRRPLHGIAGQHADAAVHIEPGIAQGRASAGGERVQLVPVLAQVGAERLQQGGPLVEGQVTQRAAAGPAVRRAAAKSIPQRRSARPPHP